MVKEKYFITGMTCSACSARVEKAVRKLEGQKEVTVNLLTNSMQVSYEEGQLSPAAIIAAVEKAGYGAALAEGNAATKGKNAVQQGAASEEALAKEAARMRFRLVWSIVFLLPLMYVAMHGMLAEYLGIPVSGGVKAIFDGRENALTFAFAQFLLACPILLLNNRYFVNGFRNLFRGSPNMDSLVGMGSAASMFAGTAAIFAMSYGMGHGDWQLVEEYRKNLYFESAGMIVTLITVGKYLEAKAKSTTGEALKKLMNLLPQTAVVLRHGKEVELPAAELVVGDEVIVKPGGVIAADGVILTGSANFDEAAVTGESMPAAKGVGDRVISATINLDGYIHFRAEKVGADSTISQIIKLVDEASASKAPIAKMADKIAGVFVPAVIGIALAAACAWLAMGESAEFAFSIAVSVLVISCPCALGLATPVAIMVGTGKGAEKGILIKAGEALERAKHIDAVILDKTGTITEGKPHVTDIIALHGTANNLLQKLASLEKASQHPLAQAIIAYAAEKKFKLSIVRDFVNEPGKGISGALAGERLFAGNAAYMAQLGIDVAAHKQRMDALSDMGKTVLLLANDKQLLGMVAVADIEKATSRQAVAAMHRQGLEVIMLTGDNERTARSVANRLGINNVLAQVLPQDKEEAVRSLQRQGKTVAMVGDGINDAPALAAADVGIAIGAGADIALESADVVLAGNNLLDVANAIKLSRAVVRNIKENLFWAFFYNVVCIPLAAGVFYPAFGLKLSPMIGAAAMSMSSVCVVLNALRLKRFDFMQALDDSEAEEDDEQDVGLVVTVEAVDVAGVVDVYEVLGAKAAGQNIKVKEASSDGGEGEAGKEVGKMKTELKIEGMMCQHCQKHVHDALAKMDGVTSVEVSLENKSATVEASREIAKEEFAAVITEAGYELL